jgi:hypothetical protein
VFASAHSYRTLPLGAAPGLPQGFVYLSVSLSDIQIQPILISREVLEMIGMNRWPMGFLKITKGVVEQFVWNRSAVEKCRNEVRRDNSRDVFRGLSVQEIIRLNSPLRR